MKVELVVNEIFGPTIQGEGPDIGKPCIFIRMQGCDGECKWCDTKYARLFDEGTIMDETRILDKVHELNREGEVSTVVLTGGNPALQPLSSLVRTLKAHGYRVTVETQGSVWTPWLTLMDLVTVSPKPPSAEHEQPIADEFLKFEALNVVFKFVVFGTNDLEYVIDFIQTYPNKKVYLQVGTWGNSAVPDVMLFDYGVLVQTVTHHPVLSKVEAILPQMHVLLWGKRRGV